MDLSGYLIGLLAAAFFGLALWIAAKQCRAKTCGLHNKHADRLAVVLAVICGLVAVSLVALSASA